MQKFWSKKFVKNNNCLFKKNWVKNCLVKKIWVKRNFWVKKFRVKKTFQVEKFLVKKKLVSKDFWVRKIFCLKKQVGLTQGGEYMTPPPEYSRVKILSARS